MKATTLNAPCAPAALRRLARAPRCPGRLRTRCRRPRAAPRARARPARAPPPARPPRRRPGRRAAPAGRRARAHGPPPQQRRSATPRESTRPAAPRRRRAAGRRGHGGVAYRLRRPGSLGRAGREGRGCPASRQRAQQCAACPSRPRPASLPVTGGTRRSAHLLHGPWHRRPSAAGGARGESWRRSAGSHIPGVHGTLASKGPAAARPPRCGRRCAHAAAGQRAPPPGPRARA